MGQKKDRDDYYREFRDNASQDDIKTIDEKLDGMNRGPIAQIWDDVQILYKLVKDPNRAWGSKIAIVATLIYLISPIDGIPDFIPFIGFTDDIALIAFTVKQFKSDIDEYKARHGLK